MKCSRDGFCNVVYAMHRFFFLRVMCYYMFISESLYQVCLRIILLDFTIQLTHTYIHTYSYPMLHIFYKPGRFEPTGQRSHSIQHSVYSLKGKEGKK